MKKIITSILFVVMFYSFLGYVSAIDINSKCSENLLYKWYDGSDTWNKDVESPVGIIVDSNLVEGVDYIREYAYTKNRRDNVDDLNDWSSTAKGMSSAGFIWERVNGIGEYESSKAIRHEIYTAIYVYANDLEKYKGDNDPEYTYSIVMHNNNPNNIMDKFNITFKREEGEDIGEYKITPVIEKKDNISDDYMYYNNKMAIGDDTGRVYIYPVSGTLKIKEKEDVIQVSDEIDIITPPHTYVNY